MEERVSDLDAENRMLRQAVASTPAIKSPASENHKAHELQVPIITNYSINNYDAIVLKHVCAC